jgi:hypothetical protein
MVRSSHAAVVFALLFAGFASAEMRIGPAVPLARTSIELQAAAFGQGQPVDVASNGHDFLAVWRDERNGREPGEGSVYVGRFDEEGRPTNPFGRRVAEYGHPQIASNGEDYLLVWYDGVATHAQRLDRDGDPLAAEQTVDDTLLGTPYLLSSNGSSYLLISQTRGGTYTFIATLLRSDGSVLHTPFRLSRYVYSAFVDNGRYVLLADVRAGGIDGLAEIAIEESGRITDARVLTWFPPDRAFDSAATAHGNILIATFSWSNPHAKSMALLDRGGTTSHWIDLPSHADRGYIRTFSDGNEFLLWYEYGTGYDNVDLIRVSARGEVLQNVPYHLTSTARWSSTAFASNGQTRLLLWPDARASEAGDLCAYVGRSIAELASPAASLRIATYSRYAQIGAQIAVAGAHQMAVWTDDQHKRISGAIDGLELTIAATYDDTTVGLPAVTASEHGFLAAWIQGTDLLAIRYSFNGVPLDPQPLVLGRGVSVLQGHGPVLNNRTGNAPGIAFDGDTFVVAAAALAGIRVAYIDAATGFVRAFWQPPPLSASTALRVTPVRIGSRWLLPHTYFHPPSELTEIAVADISSARPFKVLSPAATDRGNPSLAAVAVNRRVTFAWASQGKIVLVQSDENGTASSHQFTSERADLVGELALVWDGSMFVLTWTEQNARKTTESLLALRLDADLHPLDETPIAIDTDGVTIYSKPSIAAAPYGVVIAYSKRDAENGDAPRAFTRTLFR